MWYNNTIFSTHIKKKHLATGTGLLGIALALLIAVSTMQNPHSTLAAGDEMCGDAFLDTGEQCDDGNLQNGDGCSNICTVEICGNNRVDANEQCDDGNAGDGDGCNRYCQIEFCGDRKTHPLIGEECDDGNGVNGDGCSSQCKTENKVTVDPLAPEPEQLPPESEVPLTPAEQAAQALVAAKKIFVSEVQKVTAFLTTDDGEDIAKYFTREESLQLEQIITKLKNGRRLTTVEREWAVALVQKLQEAKVLERTRYTDLLKEFIATPISSDVVDEKDLEKQNLVDVQVPIAIAELNRAVDIIRRGELQKQVTVDIAKLKRQGLDTAVIAPENITKNLVSKRPIEVFASLKALKESSEEAATTDIASSLSLIRAEAATLKEALPIFVREYGVNADELTSLLTSIDDISKEVTKQDVYRVVSAINRFLEKLERANVISQAELASYTELSPHAAAGALRIAESLGEDAPVTQGDMAGFVSGLASTVPEKERKTFAEGTDEGQRLILANFLANDERVTALRTILRDDGRTDFELRYTSLQRDIRSAGDGLTTESFCDDDVPSALQCVNEYLSDLQDAVRGRSPYTRVVGYFQDLFGIK